MARNTNIEEILFSVNSQFVFLANQQTPIPGFNAISGIDSDKKPVVFSIVSDNYELITNQQALDMGKVIHKKLFPNASSESFEVFNVFAPKTNSFCHIDIIDKNYTMNIWEKEVYVPFVRIQNSYNRSRKLKFDLGFCRMLCDNGAIYEEGFVSIDFTHTKKSLNGLDINKIDISKLQNMQEDFIKKTKHSADLVLPRKFFLPLAAKVLNRNFNLKEKDDYKRFQIERKLNEFITSIEDYTDKYIKDQELGETAYAFFNVITDYDSNNKKIQVSARNGLQTNCGQWLNLIANKSGQLDFSWDKEIEKYEYLKEIERNSASYFQ